jgi:hypothetical protein
VKAARLTGWWTGRLHACLEAELVDAGAGASLERADKARACCGDPRALRPTGRPLPRHHQEVIHRLAHTNQRQQDTATAGRSRKSRLVGRVRRSGVALLILIAVAVVLVTLVLTSVISRDKTQVSAEPARGHVHALAVNPRDDALLVASHTGLYRVARGERAARRVGDRSQDTIGFVVVGADRFLGSGHPDSRDALPPRLGLIRSRDGGKTWTPVSLLGEADFHVLRARGAQIVGYDATSGNILTSRDGGRHWRRHRFEGPLVDLVIAPGPSRTLLATAPAQLLLSRDGGRSWRSVAETTGLLAWPRPRQLYLLASDGRLWLSPDVGKRWRALGEIGGRPAALAAYANGRIYAALESGIIKRSTDGGRSWRLLARADKR